MTIVLTCYWSYDHMQQQQQQRYEHVLHVDGDGNATYGELDTSLFSPIPSRSAQGITSLTMTSGQTSAAPDTLTTGKTSQRPKTLSRSSSAIAAPSMVGPGPATKGFPVTSTPAVTKQSRKRKHASTVN
eukprot:scpid4884/ scgid22054/ 